MRPEFEKCLASTYHTNCISKIPGYKKCEEKKYKPAEFIKITNDVAHKRVDYAGYKAMIRVLFMGPVFLHNDFEVHFKSESTVESTTPVKHWD